MTLPRILTAGAWTWFNDPRAIVVNGRVFAGAVSPTGSIIGGAELPAVVLHRELERDDHDNPAFLRRAMDGRLLACYSRHATDGSYFLKLSEHPDDMLSLKPETDIGPMLGGRRYTYANLLEIDDGIFNFFRCASASDQMTPHYSVSRDGGATWQRAVMLLSNPGQRPYFKIAKGGRNRIDIVCTDGHPIEVPHRNSVYHFYYESGRWFGSDGSPLGSPPFEPQQLSVVHDGLPKAWVWDLTVEGQSPVTVYATVPVPNLDHRYHTARWTGTRWAVSEICSAGGTLYPAGDDSEPFYSGGICIDPDDAACIYCSRETGSGGRHRNGGTFQIWKGVTRDEGATWHLQQLTFGEEDCIRPYKPAGATEVLFVKGDYKSYTDFATVIAAVSV